MALAPTFGVNPYIAVSVAFNESSLNPKAHGAKGEAGLFQIMPDLYAARGYTRAQMEEPLQNIYVGLDMLKEAKKNCVHKGELPSLVCYNLGASAAKKIKHPMQQKYVRKVIKKMVELMSREKDKL